MIGGAIPPTGFPPSWTRLNKAEIRMMGSISPRAEAALAAIRMGFRVAKIARNFDIEHLYLSMAPAKSVLRLNAGLRCPSKYASCISVIIPLSFA
jgi:hypothetical protein